MTPPRARLLWTLLCLVAGALSLSCGETHVLGTILGDGGPDAQLCRIVAARRLSPTGAVPRNPQLAWLVDRFALVYQDGSTGSEQVSFIQLGVDGEELTEALAVSPVGFGTPAVAAVGSELAFLYKEMAGGDFPDQEIWFARRTASGSLIGTDRLVTNMAGRFGGNGHPRLQWNGSVLGAVWLGGFGPQGLFSLLDSDGTQRTAPQTASGGGDSLSDLAMTWDGSTWRVGFANDGFADPGVWMTAIQSIAADGLPEGSPFALPESNGAVPVLASAPAGYAAAWGGSDGRIRFATLEGEVIRSMSVLDVAGPGGRVSVHDVESVRDGWAVIWLQSVDPNGWSVHLSTIVQGAIMETIELSPAGTWQGGDLSGPLAGWQADLLFTGDVLGAVWIGAVGGARELRYGQLQCD